MSLTSTPMSTLSSCSGETYTGTKVSSFVNILLLAVLPLKNTLIDVIFANKKAIFLQKIAKIFLGFFKIIILNQEFYLLYTRSYYQEPLFKKPSIYPYFSFKDAIFSICPKNNAIFFFCTLRAHSFRTDGFGTAAFAFTKFWTNNQEYSNFSAKCEEKKPPFSKL